MSYDEIYKKFNFTCCYCGYVGRQFEHWLQLTIDHVLPQSSGGDESEDNLVVACHHCNSVTNKMKFDSSISKKEIIKAKRKYIAERRIEFFQHWQSKVLPHILEK